MECTSSFKNFEKKMIVIVNVHSILQNVEYLVRPSSKKQHFILSYDSQHIKGSETLVKSPWDQFYHNVSSLWGEMIWKISHIVKCEILGGCVNTLTTDDKYPVRDCDNLLFPIQMILLF